MKRYIRLKDGRIIDTEVTQVGRVQVNDGRIPDGILVNGVASNILDLIQVGDLCKIKFNSEDYCYTHGTVILDEITEEELFDTQAGIECEALILLELYTKQGDNYILVWDKERGVINYA